MEGELSHLTLAAAGGAAMLTLAALAAVGGRRSLAIVRGLGLGGVLLALFVGTVVERLSIPLAEAMPYTSIFRPTVDLRALAFMEDPDLRTRYNVDPRLRYIPSSGERVPNLESGYRVETPRFRALEFPILAHAMPVVFPRGVEPLRMRGDPEALRQEVGGLFESAQATAGRADDGTLDLLRSTSVGFLALGVMGSVAGLLPLVLRALGVGRDSLRLVAATGHRSYRGARARAIRAGTRSLAQWHFREARPFASLATFGLLTLLAGLLLGFVREDETRRQAHATFAAARHLRLDAKRP